MGLVETVVDFLNNNSLLLWVLGIIITLAIPVIIPKIRVKFKRLFYRLMLKIQSNDVGINAVYLKNYLGSPKEKISDELFKKIKDEILHDKIEKISLHPRFLKIKSNKLGMKLIISIEQEHVDIVDEELEELPYNVTVEMDADIKGTSNMHNLDEFITIAEKIHEIIRTKLFPDANLGQSYAVCTINNIINDIHKESRKSFEFEDNKITIKKDSTTILAHNPRNLTKTLKKYVYV